MSILYRLESVSIVHDTTMKVTPAIAGRALVAPERAPLLVFRFVCPSSSSTLALLVLHHCPFPPAPPTTLKSAIQTPCRVARVAPPPERPRPPTTLEGVSPVSDMSQRCAALPWNRRTPRGTVWRAQEDDAPSLQGSGCRYVVFCACARLRAHAFPPSSLTRPRDGVSLVSDASRRHAALPRSSTRKAQCALQGEEENRGPSL